MNFAELKTKVRNRLWPEGEQENLFDAHDDFFLQAMTDLQMAVDCYRFGNTNVYPHCSTYFNCGMTVVDAPRGRISRVYTIGQVSTATPVAAGTQVQTTPGTTTQVNNVLATGVGIAPSDPDNTLYCSLHGPDGSLIDSCGGSGPFNVRNIASCNGTYWSYVSPFTKTIIESLPSSGEFLVEGVVDASLAFATPDEYVDLQISYTDIDGSKKSKQLATYPGSQPGITAYNGSLSINAMAGTAVVCVATPHQIAGSQCSESQFGFGVTITQKTIVTTGSTTTVPVPAVPLVSVDDWCSKVEYQPVDFCHIGEYGSRCSSCSNDPATMLEIFSSIFGCGNWKNKSRYPAPDDAGTESLPPLSGGFHYPQKSTDLGGRSRTGRFAIHRGKLWVSPWIESNESLVIEWEGLKPNWSDADFVEDDPLFIEAVALLVNIQHHRYYEDNPQRLAELKRKYHGEPGAPGVLQELMLDCRERTRARLCDEVGGKGSQAFGIGRQQALAGSNGGVGQFYNEEQSFRAECPTNSDIHSVASVGAGLVSSQISVADANAKALAQATASAKAGLASLGCTGASTFTNVRKQATAKCPAAHDTTPAAEGSDVTSTIEAGTFSGQTQQSADDAAYAAALADAQSKLRCKFFNAPVDITRNCPSGTSGPAVHGVVGAGEFTSGPSATATQKEADDLATQEAERRAAALLVSGCTEGAFLVANEEQVFDTGTESTWVPGCDFPFVFSYHSVVTAGSFTRTATISTADSVRYDLNRQAHERAMSNWVFARSVAYSAFIRNCNTKRTQ